MPYVGSSNPPIMRSVVVLPQPEGPSIEKNSPSSMSNERSSTATASPNIFVTRSTRTSISFGTPNPLLDPRPTLASRAAGIITCQYVARNPRVRRCIIDHLYGTDKWGGHGSSTWPRGRPLTPDPRPTAPTRSAQDPRHRSCRRTHRLCSSSDRGRGAP